MKSASLMIFFLLALFAFPSISFAGVIPGVACTNLPFDLSYGSSDDSYKEVTSLQTFLASMKYLTVAPNGYFGRQTEAAVRRFQTDQGISAIGVVGPTTRARIKGLSCSEKEMTPDRPGTAYPLTVSCASSFYESFPGQEMRWEGYVSGAVAPYTYSWSGTEGLAGRGKTDGVLPIGVTKIYGNPGTKIATLTVTSSDGKKLSENCGEVSVAGGSNDPLSGYQEMPEPKWYDFSWFNLDWFRADPREYDFEVAEYTPFVPFSGDLEYVPPEYVPPDYVPGEHVTYQEPAQYSPLDPKITRTPEPAPYITSLAPAVARIGDRVTIRGGGFSPRNAILVDSGHQIPGEVSSPDGNTITFTLPRFLSDACAFKADPECGDTLTSFDPGYSYDIFVVTLGADGVAQVSSGAYLAVVE